MQCKKITRGEAGFYEIGDHLYGAKLQQPTPPMEKGGAGAVNLRKPFFKLP